MRRLWQMEFKGNFKDVAFNPLIRLQSIDQLVMTKVFQAQQEFIHNTTSTLVHGLNPTVQQVITVDANTFKLCDFIMVQTVDKERILKRVV